MESIKFTVSGINDGMKIRDYLKRNGFSSSLIGEVKYDNVILNGTPVHMREPIYNGDLIEVRFPVEESENIEPIDIPLDILYEDEYIIAVNKPINMPTHPSRGNHLPTLANAVRAYIGAPFVFRSITRLDRDTSGIVLIAKDRLSASRLSTSMKSGLIKKQYLARVVGVPESKEGVIEAPIKREAEGSIKRIVHPNGKPSVTEYELLSTDNNGNSLLLVRPITGRTHQIRVHMSYIGHPLYADFLYGERIDGKSYSLHCCTLEFPHPITKEHIKIESNPTEF
ncbi:MAG: RluA family pseudouridine synthase [Clostridia bacterium]|nr:RluA family pseudouridine synthase [Clostridia bacterium]